MDNEKFQELVLEQLTGMSKRFDKMDERFDKVDERLDKMDERLDKMDERFDKMDGRLDSHESLIETVARKVNLLELGQLQITKQLAQIANVQGEIVSTLKVLVESDKLQNDRLSRLEKAVFK